MSQMGERRGLCATCVGVETCTFPYPADRSVLTCAEFEPWPPRQGATVLTSAAQASPTVNYRTRGDLPRPLGLCVNCENAEGCTFPMPEGGVWRCEEYC